MTAVDMTGRRYGRLTIIEQLAERSKEGQIRWRARCDCGNETISKGGPIRDGRTTSCGCARTNPVAPDLTAQRFGRLNVIERAGTASDGQASWLCKCDCGNVATVRGGRLRSGKTVSCGCYHRNEWVKNPTRKPVVKYGSAHRRVVKARGWAREHACHDCGDAAIDWSYQGGDPNELTADNKWKSRYSLNPTFYVARCRRCHNEHDKRGVQWPA